MTSRKIRVLEMIDEASLGGGQVHVLMLAKHLDRSRFEVEICCEGEGYLVEQAEKLGVKTHRLGIGNTLKATHLTQTLKLLRSSRWDILHTHGGTAGFWGRTVSMISRLPRVRIHTYHGLHYLNENSGAPRSFLLADRFLQHFTDRLVFVCASDLTKGLEAGIATQKNGVLIRYGIEVEQFQACANRQQMRRALGADDSDFVFGNVGRLHQQKGQSYLLRAFAHVAKIHPNARLWIIGDGELRDELHGLAEGLGVSSRVAFLGSRYDVAILLAGMDVFVLSSLWEGQPISLLEALASEKPVVATSVDGIKDILVDNVNALLGPSKDVASFAAAMERMLTDEPLRHRIAQAGKELISEEYSAVRMAVCIGSLYHEVGSVVFE